MSSLDITLDENRSQLGWLRLELLELADHVDRLRLRSGAPPVDRSVLGLDGLPSYLLEEVRVRSETVIFAELASIDTHNVVGGGRAILGQRFLEDYIFNFYSSHLRNHPHAFRPDDRPLVTGDPAATQILTTLAATIDTMLEQRASARTVRRRSDPTSRQGNVYVPPPFPPPLPQPNYNPPRGGSVFDRPTAPASASRPRRDPGRGRRPPPDAGVQPGGAVRLEHVVDLIIIQGSERNPYEDLALANRVFADCGVHFSAGAYHTIPATAALNFIGFWENMHVAGDDCPIGTVSRDTERLFNYAQTAFGLRARLRAFYVPSHDGRGHGFSFFPECTRGPAARFHGHVVIRNGAPPRTLAHELGHILLNDGLHSGYIDTGDTDNLMVPSEMSTDSLLDRAQCNVINGSTQA